MKNSKKTWTRITSSVLSIALTMQAGWCLAGTRVIAADAKGEISMENGEHGASVYLSCAEGDAGDIAYFSVVASDGEYKFLNDNPVYGDNYSVTVDSIASIEVGSNCRLSIDTDIDSSISLGGEGAEVFVSSGSTFKCSGMDGQGLIDNRGTIEFSDYTSSDYVSDYGVIHLSNSGTVIADRIDISTLYAVVGGNEMPTVSYGEDAVYKATSSFIKGDEEMTGKVVAASGDTFIYSEGGYFTLEMGSLSKSFEEGVGGTAASLLYEDTTVTLTGVPDTIYAGEDYDLSKYVIVAPEGYTGTPYIEYGVTVPADSTEFAPDRHTDPGTYRARAVAPEVTGYKSSVSEPVTYSIVYLPFDKVDNDGKYFTLEGVKNGYYVSGDLRIVPKEGFSIDDGRRDSIDGYTSYLSYGENDLWTEDGHFMDIGVSFRRDEDKAITDTIHFSEMTPDISTIIFDGYDPVIFGEEADGVETSIEDGDTIVADELTFSVGDEYLDKVIVDGKTYTGDDFDTEEGTMEITVNSTPGTPRDIAVYAVDKAGNELSLSFTLSPNPVDPELNVTIPRDIRIGHDYEITYDTNSDGAVSIDYYKGERHLDSKPAALGTYTVKVSVAATSLFNAASYEGSFEIWRNVGSLSVSIPETIYVGEDYEPEITMDHDGTPEITYRYNNEDGMPERAEKPTAAGSYLVIVRVPTTPNYYEKYSYKPFKIIKRDAGLSVTVPDTYVGESYDPSITNSSDGDVLVEYADLDADYGGEMAVLPFTEEKPVDAGHYRVMVTVSETDTYKQAVSTADFAISKRTPSLVAVIPDSYVGDTYEPSVTTDSDGSVTVRYADNNSEDPDALTETKPTAAGDYTASVTVSETDRYKAAYRTVEFTISKRTATASISVPDTTAGDSYSPVIDTNSDGRSKAVIEYKVRDAADSTYTQTKPAAYGYYTARVTIPETDKYLGVTAKTDFTITARKASVTVKVADSFAGAGFTPEIDIVSDGSATVEYRASGASDSTYTSDKPTAPGTYVIRVTVPATSIYTAASGTAEFNISYLPAPDKAYDMDGTKGNNDYFVSDVELTAPDGYSISKSIGGDYSASIPYSDDLNVVYLRRDSDGALTSAIAVSSRPSIDKEDPSFTSSVGEIVKDAILFVKEITLTASDDNLVSLTINGVDVDLANEGSVMTLTPGFGIKSFVITAEDIAGHTSTLEFTLMAEWLKDRIIPASVVLPLVIKEPYNLASGKWTVNDDKTVYNGNIPIFVNTNGDYVFTPVN